MVDVLDSERRWCLADVVASDVNSVTVQFHGWPDAFRTTLQRSDLRIQQPLTKTGVWQPVVLGQRSVSGHLDGQTGQAASIARQKFMESLSCIANHTTIAHMSLIQWEMTWMRMTKAAWCGGMLSSRQLTGSSSSTLLRSRTSI